MHSKKTETIHGWIEWICMELKPFAFADSEYTKLEQISRHTLEKYMHLLSVKVEQEYQTYCQKSLPQWWMAGHVVVNIILVY